MELIVNCKSLQTTLVCCYIIYPGVANLNLHRTSSQKLADPLNEIIVVRCFEQQSAGTQYTRCVTLRPGFAHLKIPLSKYTDQRG